MIIQIPLKFKVGELCWFSSRQFRVVACNAAMDLPSQETKIAYELLDQLSGRTMWVGETLLT